jgi:tetratricopeptide (TPR) repeat protein
VREPGAVYCGPGSFKFPGPLPANGMRAHSFVLSALALLPLAFPAGTLAQTSAPPIPELALDAYPPAAREVISRARAAAVARPADAAATATMAKTLQAWEQWDAAHQAYVRCQALAATMFECWYLDGLVVQRLARQSEAAERFARALSLTPDYLPARLGAAEALLEAGDQEASRRAFEPLANEPRAAPAAELGLGRLDALQGHQDRAIAHFQRAIELFPEFGAAYYALALAYRASGRPDEAARALAQHTRYGNRWPAVDDPVKESVAALRDDGASNLRRGIALADKGDIQGAIARHEAALAQDPTLAQAHVNLISLYGRAGEFAKAEEHYRAAVASGADLGEANYDYGVLLGMQEKWDLAAAMYRKALELNPSHAHARNNLGQILERQGNMNEAAAQYRQAVESQPTFRLARFNLGRMLLAVGKNDEAIAELVKLVEPQDAETPRYVFALSAAYVRAGRKDEAIKWAMEARRLAVDQGQQDLVAIIDRDLARLK